MHISTFQDAHDWHNLVSRAVEDDIVWKTMCAQFNDKCYGLNLEKGMKVDWGVDYEDESKRGFKEKLSNFSKRQTRKITNIQRVKSHGKLLNATNFHNKVPNKTKPNELTSRKRMKGKY